MLLLSYFYDRIHPIIPPSTTNSNPITISTIAQLAKSICEGEPTWTRLYPNDRALLEELRGRPEWCLDLTFMHALLRLGYEFGDEREVVLGKRVEGTELGWALGATLAVLAGKLECRA
jgi:guanosine-diphosphatase